MRSRIIAIGLLLASLTGMVMAQSGQDLYQRGLGREQLGDYEGAIKIYERVVREFSSDRALAAKAKLHLGDSLMKQGEARGLEVLNDVINNHKDQTEMVASARLMVTARATWAGPNTSDGGDLRLETLFTKDPYSFAISPEGRRVVYQASVSGKNQLWLHDLDTRRNEPLLGTEGAAEFAFPFWSPNGKSIGFFADGKLKRIDIAGGPATVLADAAWNRGGAWSKDDVILFAPFDSGPLYSMPARGGALTAHAPDDAIRRQFPQFLPDGRRFLYATDTRWMVGNLDSSTSQPFRAMSPAVSEGPWVPWAVVAAPDRLFREGPGFAMATLLNLETLQTRPLSGDASRVTGAIGQPVIDGKGSFSASAAGPIAYRKDVAIQRSLIWRDRQGRNLASFDLPLGATRDLRLSPDGNTAIFRSSSAGDILLAKDLFLLELQSGFAAPRMFVHGSLGDGGAWSPVWSPDGTQVVLSRRQGSSFNLFTNRTADVDNALAKLASPEVKFASDWSEGFLLYERISPVTGADLVAAPVDGGEPAAVAATAAMESAGRFSPNGQWVAYQSNADGRYEVYVQPFPGSLDSRVRVSNGGGTSPEWRHDGKELYFLSSENRLMAVPVAVNGQMISLGKPAALFSSPLPDDSTYASAPDGRFLINAPTTRSAPPIYVVSNWTPPTAAANTAAEPQTEIALLDRQGKRLRSVITPGARTVLALSPDGNRVSLLGSNQTLWTIDLHTSVRTQIATAVTSAPVWSPDSSGIAYVANRAPNPPGLYLLTLNGVSVEKLLYAPVTQRGVMNWAMEGRFILMGMGVNWALLPTTGESRQPIPILPLSLAAPRLSPNGRFVALVSNEGASAQVWIRQVATRAGEPVVDDMRWKVSTEGSVGMVRWRADGNELYYLALDGRVMAVSITTAPEFQAGTPRMLFQAPPGFPIMSLSGAFADVSADGERFVFAMPAPAAPPR